MECRYYSKLDDGAVECNLCPHHCHIADGKTGVCRSRRNHSGVLISEVYGQPCALAIDPIEKKPLYHFHPGTTCLSLACTGCNFRCLNCQNHDISQASPSDVQHYDLTPEALVALCQQHHCPGIAYTYTEPLTYLEYTSNTSPTAPVWPMRQVCGISSSQRATSVSNLCATSCPTSMPPTSTSNPSATTSTVVSAAAVCNPCSTPSSP